MDRRTAADLLTVVSVRRCADYPTPSSYVKTCTRTFLQAPIIMGMSRETTRGARGPIPDSGIACSRR